MNTLLTILAYGILAAILGVIAITFVKDGGIKGIVSEWRDAIRNDN